MPRPSVRAARLRRGYASCRRTGSGSKIELQGISKRGDTYLRTLLVHGARSIIYRVKEPGAWVEQMKQRRPVNVVVVAMANKLAQIWEAASWLPFACEQLRTGGRARPAHRADERQVTLKRGDICADEFAACSKPCLDQWKHNILMAPVRNALRNQGGKVRRQRLASQRLRRERAGSRIWSINPGQER